MARKKSTTSWEALAAEAIESMVKRDTAFEKFTTAQARSVDAVELLKTALREEASNYSSFAPQQRSSFDVIRKLFPQLEVDNAVEQSVRLHRLEMEASKVTQQQPQTVPRNGGTKEVAR